LGQCSAAGEAVSVGGFDDDAGSGHFGEAFVEGGGANAAERAQLGEWPRFCCSGERCSDALVDGSLLDGAFGLGIGLDGLQGEGVIALGEFESDAGDGGGGAMLDGQDDAVVTVAAEVEVGIAPGVEFGRSAQGLTGTDGTGALSGVVDDGQPRGSAPRNGPSVSPRNDPKEGPHGPAKIREGHEPPPLKFRDQKTPKTHPFPCSGSHAGTGHPPAILNRISVANSGVRARLVYPNLIAYIPPDISPI